MADDKARLLNRGVRYTNPDAEIPTVYANNVEMGLSPWDMRFRFGQIESADEKELVIKNILTVYMSIDHARIFVDRLNETLKQWDAMNAKAKAAGDNRSAD